jgi:succinate dehydrogenase / fumarate reductase cytochrome b subunit
MNRLAKTMSSSIGAKWVMGLTGLGLLGFVLAHMAGNLLVFQGQEALNAYAKKLHDLGPILWALRGGLLVMFVLHVATAARITRENREARPDGYSRPQVTRKTTYAARTMVMSGLIVLAFVIYHLLHFTFGVVQPDAMSAALATPDPSGMVDVYGMVIAGFSNPLIVASYVFAMVVLCMHIAHGASSVFQTLGVTYPSLGFLRHGAGKVLAGVILLGNLAIPLAILFGLIGKGV